jgi:hypothetical protein
MGGRRTLGQVTKQGRRKTSQNKSYVSKKATLFAGVGIALNKISKSSF